MGYLGVGVGIALGGAGSFPAGNGHPVVRHPRDCEGEIEARASYTPHELADGRLGHADFGSEVILTNSGVNEICVQVAHIAFITLGNITVKNKIPAGCLPLVRCGRKL